MPSQSSLEGEGTLNHLIKTVSPELFRILGEIVRVGAEEARVWVKKRRKKKRANMVNSGENWQCWLVKKEPSR